VTFAKTVVKNAPVPLLPSFSIEAVPKRNTPPLSHLASGHLRMLGGRFCLHDAAGHEVRQNNTQTKGLEHYRPEHCTRLPESHSALRSRHDAPTMRKHVRLYQRGVPVAEGRSFRVWQVSCAGYRFTHDTALLQVGSVAALP
jgi:hypothetical protein